LTLDTPDDYRLLARLYDQLGPRVAETSLAEIIALVDDDPESRALAREGDLP